MIHPIKPFDERDEVGINCNVWMQIYNRIVNKFGLSILDEAEHKFFNNLPNNIDLSYTLRNHLATIVENPSEEPSE